MIESNVASHYLAAQRSFTELARSLAADEWSTPVPCTPQWTVRDVLSHVSGITDDALAGRLDGAPSEAWTAAQVTRNRHADVEELLARWEEQAPLFAEAIGSMGEVRPPIDCHAHEHDVRHALDRPGNRDSDIVEAAVASMVTRLGDALTVRFAEGRTIASDAEGERVTLSGVTPFEVFRSRLGRRSAAQVAGYDWEGDPDRVAAVQAAWFTFGPSPTPIFE